MRHDVPYRHTRHVQLVLTCNHLSTAPTVGNTGDFLNPKLLDPKHAGMSLGALFGFQFL